MFKCGIPLVVHVCAFLLVPMVLRQRHVCRTQPRIDACTCGTWAAARAPAPSQADLRAAVCASCVLRWPRRLQICGGGSLLRSGDRRTSPPANGGQRDAACDLRRNAVSLRHVVMPTFARGPGAPRGGADCAVR